MYSKCNKIKLMSPAAEYNRKQAMLKSTVWQKKIKQQCPIFWIQGPSWTWEFIENAGASVKAGLLNS